MGVIVVFYAVEQLFHLMLKSEIYFAFIQITKKETDKFIDKLKTLG